LFSRKSFNQLHDKKPIFTILDLLYTHSTSVEGASDNVDDCEITYFAMKNKL